MNGARREKLPPVIFHLIGLLLFTLCWELLSLNFSGLVIVGPTETIASLFRLFEDKTFFFTTLFPTLRRIGLALFFGIGTGGVLGILAGFVKSLQLILDPVRWILTCIPGVIILIIFMLWLGMGTTMVVSITATMIVPIVYVNVINGMMSVDRNLLEMARVYRLPFHIRLLRIYAMALAGPFLSGAVIATGNCIRMVILAEMFGANEGIGHALSISRANLEINKIYALTLMTMLVVGGVELFLLRPVRKAVAERRI